MPSRKKLVLGITPGDWELYAGHLIRAVDGHIATPVADLEAPHRRGVGLVKGERETRANGHLLAAAPTLFGACEAVANAVTLEDFETARALARLAMRKAVGR